MATFAAKYLVSGVSKQINLETLTKLDFDRAEKELEKEDTERRKKHAKQEKGRQKLRQNIREKYSIDERKGHEAGVQNRSGLLVAKTEKDLLLEEEDDSDSDCCPRDCLACGCFASFLAFFKNDKSKAL